MKLYNNTLKAQSTTKFNSKGEVSYQTPFSNEEELTALDYELITDRTTSEYIPDENYEAFWDEREAFLFNNEANIIREELQYDSGDSFQIGNNVKGGI